MNIYSELYGKIEAYKDNFEFLLSYLEKSDNLKEKYEIACFAADYFTEYCTGYFISSKLEKFFLDFAKTIDINLDNIHFIPNSVIHIMSEAYHTGGHTRVVERWIKNASQSQKNSILFTSQNSTEFKVLYDNVKEKKGDYILLGNISLEEKVKKIREVCMQYEYVVLHTHMNDPIPIMAFGVESFTRPVLFYNHASHRPWLGKYISDLVIDIENNDFVTRKYRNIKKSFFLGIPSNEISIDSDNKILKRRQLGLPLDKKIIVTSGSEQRYTILCKQSFVNYLDSILESGAYCYVIGVNSGSKDWREIEKKYNGRLHLLGFINYNEGYMDYLKAADLYLDSYPLPGGTATIDAISCGAPVIALSTAYPQLDYLTSTTGFCKTPAEFIDKAKRVLNDNAYAKVIFNEECVSLLSYQSPNAWRKRIDELFKSAPTTHAVKVPEDFDCCEINDVCVLSNAVYINNFIKNKVPLFTKENLLRFKDLGFKYKSFGIPFIVELISFKKIGVKARLLKILGFDVYTHRKLKK